MAITPQSPIRADHRFIMKLISSVMSGKVEDRPEEFRRITDKFAELGGSWVRVFGGSSTDIQLLKKIIKAFFKKGLLTKAPSWSAKDA